MIWKAQEELTKARREPQRQDGTLYGAAIHLEEKKTLEDKKTLTNQNFLDQLVEEKKIDQAQAAEYLRILDDYAEAVDKNKVNVKDYLRVLFYASLPESYAHSDIAALLVKTGRLSNPKPKGGVKKRVDETGKIIFNVITGMGGGAGDGFLVAFKELGVRHRTLATAYKQPGDFPYINQVSLAYTLLTFSYTPFEAIKRSGRAVPDYSVRTTWLNMWNIVGSLMGIEYGGLPATPDDASQLLALIRASAGYGHTEAGTKLMAALKGIAKIDKESSFDKYAGKELMALLAAKK